MVNNRPQTTVILAMSADGKIADVMRSPARFGSSADKAHLEKQIALVDAVLFGAGTLRAYGTTLTVSSPELLKLRQTLGKPPQPIQIVASHSGKLNRDIRFFEQPIKRWLLTTGTGAQLWSGRPEFERILVFQTKLGKIGTQAAMQKLKSLGIQRLAVLGGGDLVASMVAADLIDELWLTICPLILGGTAAPTPVAGKGFISPTAPHLELLEVQTVGQEVFLHYRLQRQRD